MHGAGKYDKEATILRALTNAEAVLVMVIGGDKGSGFSVQLVDTDDAARRTSLVNFMAAVMRNSAEQLESDMEKMAKGGG